MDEGSEDDTSSEEHQPSEARLGGLTLCEGIKPEAYEDDTSSERCPS